jgi:hypothetical protein
MFEFTREFILNDITNVAWEAKPEVLRVPKMINIEKSKVHSIHHAPYMAAKNEVLKLDVTNLNGALTITIGQEGRVISLVSSRDAENQKDYIFNGTPADWARQFARQAAMEDMDRLIDVVVDPGQITINALDCYTRILSVSFDGMEGKNEVKKAWSRKEYWQEVAGAPVARTWKEVATGFMPGTEGMGTVARLQKNNRVLTAANITPYGFDRDERPVPGGMYHQFTIQYISERRHQTAGVFGAIDRSLTTLVFFVLDADAAKFEGLLKNLGNVCPVAVDAESDGFANLPGTQGVTAANVTENAPVVEAKEEIIPSKKHKE